MNAKTETPVVGAPQEQAVAPRRPGKCMMTRRRFLRVSGPAQADGDSSGQCRRDCRPSIWFHSTLPLVIVGRLI